MIIYHLQFSLTVILKAANFIRRDPPIATWCFTHCLTLLVYYCVRKPDSVKRLQAVKPSCECKRGAEGIVLSTGDPLWGSPVDLEGEPNLLQQEKIHIEFEQISSCSEHDPALSHVAKTPSVAPALSHSHLSTTCFIRLHVPNVPPPNS